MGDLDFLTQDVTVKDDISGNKQTVNSDNEGLVHDQHVIDLLDIIANTPTTSTNLWQDLTRDNLGYAVTYDVTLGTGEQDILLLYNPAASGLDLRIKGVTFGIQTAATAMTFKTYLAPTVTTPGTGLTEINYHDRAVTATGLAYSLPTISARGAPFLQFDLNSGGTGVLSLDADLSLFIGEDEYMLITATPSAANKSMSVNLSWAEDDSLHV